MNEVHSYIQGKIEKELGDRGLQPQKPELVGDVEGQPFTLVEFDSSTALYLQMEGCFS